MSSDNIWKPINRISLTLLLSYLPVVSSNVFGRFLSFCNDKTFKRLLPCWNMLLVARSNPNACSWVMVTLILFEVRAMVCVNTLMVWRLYVYMSWLRALHCWSLFDILLELVKLVAMSLCTLFEGCYGLYTLNIQEIYNNVTRSLGSWSVPKLILTTHTL